MENSSGSKDSKDSNSSKDNDGKSGTGISIPKLRRQEIINAFKRAPSSPDQPSLLILDHRSIQVLNYNLNVKNLDKLNIRRPYIQLSGIAKAEPDLNAIYFLTPSETVINDLLAVFTPTSSDPKTRVYRGAYVFFTSALPDRLLKRIIGHRNLKRHLQAMMELNIEFETFDRKVFLTRLANLPLYRMYSPRLSKLKAMVKNRELGFIAKKIANFVELLDVGSFDIRYFEPAKNLVPVCRARRLARYLHEEMVERLGEEAMLGSNRDEGLRTQILIVDRSIDPLAPLLHEFTYQAMVYDLLDINNKDEFIYLNQKGRARKNRIRYYDNMWEKYGQMHIGEMYPLLTNEFNEFLENNKELVEFETGKLNKSLRKLSVIVNNIHELQSKKATFSLHISLLNTCMKTYRELQLKDIARIEQDLVMGRSAKGEKYENYHALADIKQVLLRLKQIKPAKIQLIARTMTELRKIKDVQSPKFIHLIRHVKLYILDLASINQNAFRLLLIYMQVNHVPQDQIVELVFKYGFHIDDLKAFDIEGFIRKLRRNYRRSVMYLPSDSLEKEKDGDSEEATSRELIAELGSIKMLARINGLMSMRNLKFMVRRRYVANMIDEVRKSSSNPSGGANPLTLSNIVDFFSNLGEDSSDALTDENGDKEEVYELSRYTPVLKGVMAKALRGVLDTKLFPVYGHEPNHEETGAEATTAADRHAAESEAYSDRAGGNGGDAIPEGKQRTNTWKAANSVVDGWLTTLKSRGKSPFAANVSNIFSSIKLDRMSMASATEHAQDVQKRLQELTEFPKDKPVLILFIIGGVTLSEVRSAHELRKKYGCEVLLGSTHFLTPNKYLNELAILRDYPIVLDDKEVEMENSCYSLGYIIDEWDDFDPIVPFLPQRSAIAKNDRRATGLPPHGGEGRGAKGQSIAKPAPDKQPGLLKRSDAPTATATVVASGEPAATSEAIRTTRVTRTSSISSLL
ncbi:syntaxin binding protein 1 [Spiromyces aspiralis]|uniref:Syntaxin binding protein 1 n=1 Tax=Spiromyces aspiralis TaxID=68401 RepID=A0ACC1HW23_9FUNG|nr:syntaxin binding protein 1 [Spiromyces aspiralis]